VPAIPFLSEPLSDGRVAVRDYAQRDIPEILIAYQDDPHLHLSLGRDRPPSAAELGRCAEEEPSRRAAGVLATFTILERGLDVCRGQLTMLEIDWDHRRAELGLWLAPRFRGRGLASGALRLAAPWLLAVCALHRLAILTDTANESMIRTARAAGFTFEGVLRGHTRSRGARVDSAVLSLVPADLEG
jgi:RimJ/RimL family protein N-acetyltransferase